MSKIKTQNELNKAYETSKLDYVLSTGQYKITMDIKESRPYQKMYIHLDDKQNIVIFIHKKGGENNKYDLDNTFDNPHSNIAVNTKNRYIETLVLDKNYQGMFFDYLKKTAAQYCAKFKLELTNPINIQAVENNTIEVSEIQPKPINVPKVEKYGNVDLNNLKDTKAVIQVLNQEEQRRLDKLQQLDDSLSYYSSNNFKLVYGKERNDKQMFSLKSQLNYQTISLDFIHDLNTDKKYINGLEIGESFANLKHFFEYGKSELGHKLRTNAKFAKNFREKKIAVIDGKEFEKYLDFKVIPHIFLTSDTSAMRNEQYIEVQLDDKNKLLLMMKLYIPNKKDEHNSYIRAERSYKHFDLIATGETDFIQFVGDNEKLKDFIFQQIELGKNAFYKKQKRNINIDFFEKLNEKVKNVNLNQLLSEKIQSLQWNVSNEEIDTKKQFISMSAIDGSDNPPKQLNFEVQLSLPNTINSKYLINGKLVEENGHEFSKTLLQVAKDLVYIKQAEILAEKHGISKEDISRDVIESSLFLGNNVFECKQLNNKYTMPKEQLSAKDLALLSSINTVRAFYKNDNGEVEHIDLVSYENPVTREVYHDTLENFLHTKKVELKKSELDLESDYKDVSSSVKRKNMFG